MPHDPNDSPFWTWLLRKTLLWLGLGLGLLLFVGALAVGIALAVAYPKLPDISELQDYRPKLPLRIYSSDGALLGEFGEERRQLTPIKAIPQVMINAVLAVEDARFFSHNGIDYRGMLRAAVANLGHLRSQGASTITMQVARNVYLSSERTFTRKLYEVLLTHKLERMLGKEQILEIYMNQIFLGHRAYGFAAAAEIYLGKSMKDLTIAEAAMLAGLPKAPSAYNPISNPQRARVRQLYIIDRMLENGFITAAQAEVAKKQEIKLRNPHDPALVHAEFLAEMVRQLIYKQYGDATYTRGLNVYTTIRGDDQKTAYQALRKGIMDYERRQVYRGPEKFLDLPADVKQAQDLIEDTLADHPDNGDLMAAVVLEAHAKKIVAERANGERIEISGENLKPAQSGLSDNASAQIRIRRGAVIRVLKTPKGLWEITQLPEVEGAFVAIDPQTGALLALVGGFDFDKNKFNHVTQAWRQPGSSFKPFIYSAALEKGFNGATVVNDAPLFFSATDTGSQPWEPKNYDGSFDGPIPLRRALAKSKNMVSIRVLQSIGPSYAQQWAEHFGFDADKHPPYLTMALGAGSVTPMQMVTAYSVFANGGYRVAPFLITRITEQTGKVLLEATPPALDETKRAIGARNAFVMSSLLQEITRSGTAARAQATLKRPDLYGKTGTTNDSLDAWFVGFQPAVAAAVWIGYDTPRKLGDRETGGGLSLPIWIAFMETALKNQAVQEITAPEGVVNVGGEWFYEEFARGNGVPGLNPELQGTPAQFNNNPTTAPPPNDSIPRPNTPASPTTAPRNNNEEKKRILDFFRG